jgi:hypothetical protein
MPRRRNPNTQTDKEIAEMQEAERRAAERSAQNVQESGHTDVATLTRPDALTPGSSGVQTIEHSNVQALQPPDVQDTRSLEVQREERPDSQTPLRVDVWEPDQREQSTSRKPKEERNRQTVYLEPDLDDWIRSYVNAERKRRGHRVEISEIVNVAVRQLKETLEGK